MSARSSSPTCSISWFAASARWPRRPGLAAVHLRDPHLRELARADVVEDALHALAHVRVDHARPAHVVAELRGVRDRPAHVLEAALPDEVDDQLQLVEALVVGDLGLVARGDEGLEAGADQLGRAAAEDGLLAEEVGLRLLAEGRLEDSRATRADPDRVGEREVARTTGGVLLDRDQRRRSKPSVNRRRTTWPGPSAPP